MTKKQKEWYKKTIAETETALESSIPEYRIGRIQMYNFLLHDDLYTNNATMYKAAQLKPKI